MKKIIVLLLSLITVSKLLGQEVARDTIKKNELSVNLAPALQLLSGAMPVANSHLSIDYYRYLKSPLIFHVGLSFFPFTANQQYYSSWQYYSTVEDKNIFQSYYYTPQLKTQLSTGIETIFRSNRFTHGFGADILVGFQNVYYNSQYTWAFIGEQPFEHVMSGDTTNHMVDSLGYFERSKEVSAGIHLFYSLRYQFTKRFCLMIQTGPAAAIVFAQRRKEDFSTDQVTNSQVTYFDFPMPLIGRISFGFKF